MIELADFRAVQASAAPPPPAPAATLRAQADELTRSAREQAEALRAQMQAEVGQLLRQEMRHLAEGPKAAPMTDQELLRRLRADPGLRERVVALVSAQPAPAPG